MASKDPWPDVGRFVKERREAAGLGLRAADRASTVKEPTWRRLESGRGVSAPNLYKMLSAVGLTEQEAQSIFKRVGLDFDQAAYQQPDAIARMHSVIRSLKHSAEEAEAVLVRLEAEVRGRR